IIERCYNACISIIDAVSICHNGDDDTGEILKKLGKKDKIPVNVFHTPWYKDFGKQRTESFDVAVKFVQEELKWTLDKSYCLLLDADMILEISDNFNKQILKDTGYYINQYNSEMTWKNMRLIRMD